GRIGRSGDTSVAHGNREVPGGGAFQNDARIADRAVAAVHSYHPSSNVVTPNTRSSVSGRIAPVYIRAVSNTGKSSRSCASATASSLTLGTSRKISRAPAAAIRAARTASAAARSSAMSGPILWPRRRGRITPHPPTATTIPLVPPLPTTVPARALHRAQKPPARPKKTRPSPPLSLSKGPRRERHDTRRRPRGTSDAAAVADIGIGEPESGLAI